MRFLRKKNIPCGVEAHSVWDFERGIPTVRGLAVLVNRLHVPSSPVRVCVFLKKAFEEDEPSKTFDVRGLRGSRTAQTVELGAIQRVPVCVEQVAAILVQTVLVGFTCYLMSKSIGCCTYMDFCG